MGTYPEVHILTIDLEDYFMVSAFDSVVSRKDWDLFESRVENNTRRLLEIVKKVEQGRQGQCFPSSLGVKATFFVLGWVGERYPQLIKEIRDQGHEIASHGYDHKLVHRMGPEEFRDDIRKSKAILEDVIGEEVIGYRAPSYSISNNSLWAFKILAEEGYRYDSSIFPIHHDLYGMPEAPRFPYDIVCQANGDIKFLSLGATRLMPGTLSLIEFPLSTIRFFHLNLPVCGGGYFRLLPYRVTKRALRWIHQGEKKSFIFYLHPWEIDSQQPKIKGAGPKAKFRHYLNLNKTEKRFQKLLRDFPFSSIRQVMGRYFPPPPSPV